MDATQRDVIPHNQVGKLPISSIQCLSAPNTFLRECQVCYTDNLEVRRFANFCFREFRITGDGESIKDPRHPATICRPCLERHATTALGDGRLFVVCPAVSCGRTLQTRELKDIVKPDVYSKLIVRIREAEERAQNEDVSAGGFIDAPMCPTAGHSMEWVVDSSSAPSPYTTAETWTCIGCKGEHAARPQFPFGTASSQTGRWVCLTCSINFCTSCRGPPLELRRCPKCDVRIEKNEGCSSMRCYRCGENFKWESAKLAVR